MAKDKYDFIEELLENKKLSQSQREKVLFLLKEEIKKDVSFGKKLEERIEKLESTIIPDKKQPNKMIIIHNPHFISKYLKRFKENTALKWTTHVWDEKKYETINAFIEELNEDKDYQKIFNYNINLSNLLKYFIYNPKQVIDQNGMPEYGWPNLNDIKIGWQFPNNLLINWCKEFYDKPEGEKKYPFQFVLPKEFQPQRPVKGKMITTFENVVDVFKTEIQFRDNYLYKEIRRRKSKMADFEFVGIEKFEKLDFYTYTSGFLSAVDVVLEEIKKNETEKKIFFSYELINDELYIDITQLNSFPSRKINTNDLSQFLGGGLSSIAASVFSLCDFSIISVFTDQNNNKINGELFITFEGTTGSVLKKETTIESTPRLEKRSSEIEGFTYRFKFYL